MHLVSDRAKIGREKADSGTSAVLRRQSKALYTFTQSLEIACLGSRAAAAGPDVDLGLCFHGCKPTGISRQDEAQR